MDLVPEFGLGTVVGFKDLANSLSKCGCFSLCELEVGCHHLQDLCGGLCVDPRCADILVGVGDG